MSGCNDNGSSKPEALGQSSELYGVWENAGYADVLVVDENGAEYYQYSRLGCLKADSLDNQEVSQSLNEPKFSNDQSTLTIKPLDSPFSAQLKRLDALPTFCLPENLLTVSTPTATFEYVWHTFNDYYAFSRSVVLTGTSNTLNSNRM